VTGGPRGVPSRTLAVVSSVGAELRDAEPRDTVPVRSPEAGGRTAACVSMALPTREGRIRPRAGVSSPGAAAGAGAGAPDPGFAGACASLTS